MRCCLFFLLFLFVFSNTDAQQSVKSHDSGWRFGVNLGGAYQGAPFGQNDMDSRFGMGFGFTLGRMLYQRRGDFLNLGLRGRYLWEMTTGLSTERSYAIGVSPDGSERYDLDLIGAEHYQQDPGYAYLNYRQEGRQYDLELTVGLNRLAEMTDLYFYLFGGVGVINYQVQRDQFDENGDPYDYSRIDHGAGKEAKRDQLTEMWDRDYESRVYEGGKVNSFIPSGGLGLIYQITPKLGVGFEHKVSFPHHPYQEDLFDGMQYKPGSPSQSSFEKTTRPDIYHYTALRLRWRLMQATGQNEQKEEEVRQPPTGEQQQGSVQAGPPRVDILDPSDAPHRTGSSEHGLRTRILRVEKDENITLLVNGNEVPYPAFYPERNILEERIPLKKGGNQVEVRAVNEHGSDRDRVLIVRESDTAEAIPPKVRIQDPASDPSTVHNAKKAVEADVLNVRKKSNVKFSLNGSSHSFQFDPNSGELKAQLSLIQGANLLRIEAKNKVGKDRDERTIIYRQEAKANPPRITITSPNDDPTVVFSPQGKIRAEVEGIASRSQLTVTQNGSETSDYQFFPNDQLLIMKRPLDPGNNLFRIRGSNDGGTAQDEQRIILQDEQKHAPIVDFTDPSSTKTVSSPYYTVEASIAHVSSRQHVDLTVNGSDRQGFQFDHTQASFSYDAQLQQGDNHFELEASNSQGSDRDELTIHYQPGSGDAPEVNIQQPSKKKSAVSKGPDMTVNAEVDHVPDRSGLTVTVNGQDISNYNFDPTTGALSFKRELVEGNNYFNIIASNPFGSDQASRSVLYQPAAPPAVKILDPGDDLTVQNQSYMIHAKLFRVKSAADVSVSHGKKELSKFQFDPSSGDLQASLKLKPGGNPIVVEGSNSVGTAEDEVRIHYEQKVAPKVDISYPGTSPFQSSQETIGIKGSASGIQDESELELYANGTEVQNYQFQNGQFKYQMKLNSGKNDLTAKVQNSAGQDQEAVEIHYTPVSSYKVGNDGNEGKRMKGERSEEQGVHKGSKGSKKASEKEAIPSPEVELTKPTSHNTTVKGVQVAGKVGNAEEVELFVNGKSIPFERSGSKVSADVPLGVGDNTILLKGSNASGSDSDEHTIEFTPVKEDEGAKRRKPEPEPQENPEPESKKEKKERKQQEREQKKELKKQEKEEKEDQKKKKKSGSPSGGVEKRKKKK